MIKTDSCFLYSSLHENYVVRLLPEMFYKKYNERKAKITCRIPSGHKMNRLATVNESIDQK